MADGGIRARDDGHHRAAQDIRAILEHHQVERHRYDLLMVFLALTRTTAYDCSKAEIAAAHLNACGKLPPAEGAAAE